MEDQLPVNWMQTRVVWEHYDDLRNRTVRVHHDPAQSVTGESGAWYVATLVETGRRRVQHILELDHDQIVDLVARIQRELPSSGGAS